MAVAGFLSFFLMISSVGAAKEGGDDEWVHLPNKCEGKLTVSSVWFLKTGSEDLQRPTAE